MNWYNIFYWVTVADGVKDFFDVSSNVFSWFAVIFLVATLVSVGAYGSNKAEGNIREQEDKGWKYWMSFMRRMTVWTTVFALITWTGYVFCPSKRDAVIIIAGGAVGNFITSDSSARQIPAELTLLVREKMRSEIEDLKTDVVGDTLASKSKEELIELLKHKK